MATIPAFAVLEQADGEVLSLRVFPGFKENRVEAEELFKQCAEFNGATEKQVELAMKTDYTFTTDGYKVELITCFPAA